MAKFAPVAPIHILKEFDRLNILGDYHLLLAHDIMHSQDNADGYGQIFGSREWDGTVILDNSIIELGTAVNLDVISNAAEACGANVIVLPDVLEDGQATVDSINNNLDKWQERFDNVLGDENYSFMIVPQGKTLQEFQQCAEDLIALGIVDNLMWGIPRNVVALHGTREHAINMCLHIAPYDLHMLGFSDDLRDDINCARIPGVGGIDSAVPIRVPNFDQIIAGMIAEPRGTWWDTANFDEVTMSYNLASAREVFGG